MSTVNSSNNAYTDSASTSNLPTVTQEDTYDVNGLDPDRDNLTPITSTNNPLTNGIAGTNPTGSSNPAPSVTGLGVLTNRVISVGTCIARNITAGAMCIIRPCLSKISTALNSIINAPFWLSEKIVSSVNSYFPGKPVAGVPPGTGTADGNAGINIINPAPVALSTDVQTS